MDKRKKLFNTRNIRTELADPAYKDGLLSVPDFLSARNFEIRSFEMSQLKTRAAASTRVFQSLPRTLRRRTASHNVKRVPKRLRNRAIVELQDTNPTRRKTTSKEIYRLRMSKKLLKLAARIKLLRSTPVDNPVNIKEKIKQLNSQLEQLRKSKPKHVLNNDLGSYDNTGIGQLAPNPRGNLKYSKRQKLHVWLNTHVWHAKRFHMIKRWGYQIPLAPTQKCFKSVHRASKSNTVIFDTSYYDSLVMEYDESIIKKLIRPDKKVLKGTKTYDGWLYVDDQPVGEGLVYCNKEIGKVLMRVHPSIYEELFNYLSEHVKGLQDCRYSLGSIDLVGPTSLKVLNKIFHITKDIPEFKSLAEYNDDLLEGTTFSFSIKDPRLWERPVNPPNNQKISYNDLIIALHKGIVEIESLLDLLTPEGRSNSYKNQLTIKQLNKHPNPVDIKESIPLLLTKTAVSWTLILPWYWVLPVWLQLNKVTHVHLGGVNQLKQIKFENGLMGYLQDFPFLPESWIENELEIKLSLEKYNKLPLSKRQIGKFESGLLPFGNDWEFLAKMTYITKLVGKDLKKGLNFGEYDDKFVKKIETLNDLADFVDKTRNFKLCIELFDENIPFHQSFIEGSYQINLSTLPKLPIRMIRFELAEGSLKDHARIYVENAELTNLVGFVTTGGYNLNYGKSMGLGYIVANIPNDSKFVIRNIGSSKTYPIALTK